MVVGRSAQVSHEVIGHGDDGVLGVSFDDLLEVGVDVLGSTRNHVGSSRMRWYAANGTEIGAEQARSGHSQITAASRANP
jgi:hypothetical protein